MENDKLSQLWNSQTDDLSLEGPDQIIKKARKQRKGQFISISVMSITVIVLAVYTAFYASSWNGFALGLLLMISSLAFRILLELFSLFQKESQLVALDNLSFKKYLKRHHKIRLRVNYVITPICFAIYVYGFTRLLPYFKQAFSEGFYTYILISGIASFIGIGILILHSTRKEQRFLRQLNSK